MDELTVLENDPYRVDTATGHRNGKWFAEQIARFVPEYSKVHIRGLHYLASSAGDVRKPDGKLYINSNPDWIWINADASLAGRWLGYVPFERISDQRNEEANIYVPDYRPPWSHLIGGDEVKLPETSELMPRLYGSFHGRQPYRIILITEKSSLALVLGPIAEAVGGELLAMTGETSATRIAEMAKRIADDGRPAVVLYFSDHDPSGHQMPISISRKLQALRDLLYPELTIQVRRAALTAEQANELDLPTTPLKDTERRAANWKAKTGREQTELDALIALHPGALRRLAWEAVEPFFDATLANRVVEAAKEWRIAAKGMLHPIPNIPSLPSVSKRRGAPSKAPRKDVMSLRGKPITLCRRSSRRPSMSPRPNCQRTASRRQCSRPMTISSPRPYGSRLRKPSSYEPCAAFERCF